MPEKYVSLKHFDQRINSLEKKLDSKIDGKIDGLDKKIDVKISDLTRAMKAGFEKTDQKFIGMAKHFERVHQEIENLGMMTKRGFDEMNDRFSRMDRYLLLEIEQLKSRDDRIERALLLS